MLFHLGSRLRLFELNLLKEMTRISSVSGGSITAALVAKEWSNLHRRDDFMNRVVLPIRKLASITIDAPSIIGGMLLPGSLADRVSRLYAKHLYRDATLQDLPDEPRFVINATNVETGTLWRFSKRYMRDYKVGTVESPRVSLADAVTASSAFPPVLSPFVLDVDADDFSHVEPGLDRRLCHFSPLGAGLTLVQPSQFPRSSRLLQLNRAELLFFTTTDPPAGGPSSPTAG